MKTFLKILYFVAYYTGIIKLCYIYNRNKGLNIVYHHVIPDDYWDDALHLQVAIKESVFREQISIINRRFGFSRFPGDKGCLITFDDGYKCAMIAARILDDYHATGYFFVPYNIIDNNYPLWVDTILMWCSYLPIGNYDICDKLYQVNSQESRKKLFDDLINAQYHRYDTKSVLKKINYIYPVNSIINRINNEYFSLRFCGLSSIEIESLQNRGHFIGAHSVQHDIMSLLSQEEIEKDIRTCENGLGKYYNTKVFTYPFGHYKQVNGTVVDAVAKSKFNNAFMNDEIMHSTDYTLPRRCISGYCSKYEIEANLSGFSIMIKKILRWNK